MVKFEDLLSAVDFDYEVRKNVSALNLCLIDREGAYLGGKDSYETEIDPSNLLDAVLWALERLNNYWHDSIVNDIIEGAERPEQQAKLKELSGYYPDMLKYIKDNKINIAYSAYSDDVKMLEAICDTQSIDITGLKEKVDDVNEYIIPISWSVCSTVVVKGAKNLQNAINIAREHIDDIPLPNNTEYIDGSFEINVETDEDAEAMQDYPMRGALLDVRNEKPVTLIL